MHKNLCAMTGAATNRLCVTAPFKHEWLGFLMLRVLRRCLNFFRHIASTLNHWIIFRNFSTCHLWCFQKLRGTLPKQWEASNLDHSRSMKRSVLWPRAFCGTNSQAHLFTSFKAEGSDELILHIHQAADILQLVPRHRKNMKPLSNPFSKHKP